MSIINTPAALVESFKKSGEFERLRRDLLAQFQQDDAYSGLKSKIDEIVRQRFADSPMLLYLPPENAFDEVGKEVARNKLLGAATSEAKFLGDPSFLAALQTSIQKVLDEEKPGPKDVTVVKGLESATDDSTRTPVSQDIQDAHAVPSDPALQCNAEADYSTTLTAEPSTVIAAHQAQSTSYPADAPPYAPTSVQTHTNIDKESESITTSANSTSGSLTAMVPEASTNIQTQDASAHDIVMADA